MLPKQPKGVPLIRRVVGGIIIFESLAFFGAYIAWAKLNKSRDAREQVKKSAPWALEMYYKMGETISDKNKAIRLADEQAWAAKDN